MKIMKSDHAIPLCLPFLLFALLANQPSFGDPGTTPPATVKNPKSYISHCSWTPLPGANQKSNLVCDLNEGTNEPVSLHFTQSGDMSVIMGSDDNGDLGNFVVLNTPVLKGGAPQPFLLLPWKSSAQAQHVFLAMTLVLPSIILGKKKKHKEDKNDLKELPYIVYEVFIPGQKPDDEAPLTSDTAPIISKGLNNHLFLKTTWHNQTYHYNLDYLTKDISKPAAPMIQPLRGHPLFSSEKPQQTLVFL